MDINVRQSNLVKTSGSESSQRSTRTADAASSTDRAGISGLSSLLSLALQASDSTGSSRTEELTNSVQNGTYAINYGEVSRSMVDSALRLD